MNSLIALSTLFALGADPNTATRFTKEYFVQPTKVLVSRAEVGRLNQNQLLAYFPHAGFFFKKHLRDKNYNQNIKGHFTLDLRDILLGKYDNAIVATATITGSDNEEVSWGIGKTDVVKYFTDRKIPMTAEKYLLPFYGDEKRVKISLSAKSPPSFFYLLPRIKKDPPPPKEGEERAAPTFDWDSPNESTLVEFDSGDNSGKLTSLLAGTSAATRSQFIQDHDLTSLEIKDDGDWTTAWNSGEWAFTRHYDTYWLAGTFTYLGPDGPEEARPAQSFGEFAVAISRPMPQQGFLVIPRLINPDQAKTAQLPQPTPVPVYEAVATNERTKGREKKRLDKLEIDANTFISTIVTPSILRNKNGQLQCSLPLEGDPQTPRSACFRKDTSVRILLTPNGMGNGENRFWVTDKTEIPTWQIDLRILKEKPVSMQIQGEFYPIQSK